MRRLAILALCGALLAGPAAAIQPGEMLDDPALEARARDIGRELRCMVCANQSIFDSNAGLAEDLRNVVRERILAGDSDEEAIAFIAARYGDYVLLKPPLKASTVALWATPGVLGALGLFGGLLYVRRRRTAKGDAAASVSAEEAEEVALGREILKGHER